LDWIGYGSRGLSYTLWAVTAILVLWYVCKYEWPAKWKRHVEPMAIFVVGAIVIALLIGAAYMWMPRESSNTDVLESLMARLSEIENSQEHRLNRDYPLGYIMIALSGHRKVIIPRVDLIEADWNKMTLYLDTCNMMYLQIPYLREKLKNTVFQECTMGVQQVAGSAFKINIAGSAMMILECLEARPVGIFAVLGFKEPVDTERGGE